jgi:hypothetical protein
MQHDAVIPTELLELKARFDDWRANRSYDREPTPAELRQAAAEMSRRYPSLVRRVLNLRPTRLKDNSTHKQSAPTRKKPQTAFFQLPFDAALPNTGASTPQATTDCRLQLERPDGARLTLTLPTLDFVSLHRLCADFLRG